MTYVTWDEIRQAKAMDLLTYLQNHEPYKLVRVARTPTAPVSMTT